jgi:hypothetical protein
MKKEVKGGAALAAHGHLRFRRPVVKVKQEPKVKVKEPSPPVKKEMGGGVKASGSIAPPRRP